MDMDGSFEIENACSVDEGFKKLSTGIYDVVVSDYQMPQKDGLQFLKELREQKNKIPFILFTGKGREEVAIKALNIGAEGYYHNQGSPETVYGELSHGIRLVTERAKVKSALEESENRYRAVLEQAAEGIFIHNKKGQVVDVNLQACKSLGYTREELLSMNVADISPDATNSGQGDLIWPKVLAGQSLTFESAQKRKDGSLFCVEVCLSPTIVGKETLIIALVRDIDERKKEEEILRESQHFIQKILSSNPNLIYIYDLIEHRNVYANKEVFGFFGYTPEQIKAFGSELFANIMHPDEAQAVARHHARFASAPDNTTYEIEYRMKHSNGEWRWLRSHDILFARTKEGVGKQILGSCEDITERKQFRENLAKQHELLNSLLESSEGPIFSVDHDYRYTCFNQQHAKVMRALYGADIEIGKSILDYHTNPSDRLAAKNNLDKALKGESMVIESYAGVDAKTRRYFEIAHNPVRNESNGIMGAAVFAKDITERKKVEEALVKSQEEYSSLFANLMDGFAYCQMVFDESGKPVDFVYLQINDAFEKITGLKKEIIVGKKATEAIPGIKEANPELFEIYGRVALTCQTERFEVFFKPLNMWMQISVYCPRKGFFAAIFEDISERKKTEEALKIAANIFDLATDSIFVVDTEGNIVNFNETALKLYGYNKDEMAKMNIRDLDTPETVAQIESRVKLLLERGSAVFESVQVCKDKTLLPTEIHARIIDLKGKKLILSVIRDISERKKTEERLLESEERYRMIAENAQDIITVADARGVYIYVSPSMGKLFGYDNRELIGQNSFDLIHPNDAVAVVQPALHLLLKGEEIPQVEFRFRTKSGSYLWLEGNVQAVKDAKGEIKLLVVSRNIKERKKAEEELNRTMNQLSLVNEKLGVVGGLTRHDVRNKLAVVTGYAYLLKKKHAGQADIIEGVSKIEQAVKDSEKIFEFAKLYEALGVEELKYVEVGQAVVEALALFPDLSFNVVNDCHGLKVLADSFLRQMFYNFVDNTRKYGKKTTTVKIHYELSGPDKLELIYEDDGVGISAENKSRLFSEGFSTGSTTGFGLFLISRMMDVYGWQIQEVGEPGKGAKFLITIPQIDHYGKENYRTSQ